MVTEDDTSGWPAPPSFSWWVTFATQKEKNNQLHSFLTDNIVYFYRCTLWLLSCLKLRWGRGYPCPVSFIFQGTEEKPKLEHKTVQPKTSVECRYKVICNYKDLVFPRANWFTVPITLSFVKDFFFLPVVSICFVFCFQLKGVSTCTPPSCLYSTWFRVWAVLCCVLES